GLGGFVMPQVAQVLIEWGGWRSAYPLLGLLTLIIAFPVVALWIREPRPGEGEHHRSAFEAANLPGLTVREAAATGRFWILLLVFFLVAVALNGTVAHVVPLLTDAGLSPAKAAATMGIFGLATMTGRLLAGYLVDRLFAAHVAAVLFLAPIGGFALLASVAGALPALGATLLRLGLGPYVYPVRADIEANDVYKEASIPLIAAGGIVAFLILSFVNGFSELGNKCYYIGTIDPNSICFHPAFYFGAWAIALGLVLAGI